MQDNLCILNYDTSIVYVIYLYYSCTSVRLISLNLKPALRCIVMWTKANAFQSKKLLLHSCEPAKVTLKLPKGSRGQRKGQWELLCWKIALRENKSQESHRSCIFVLFIFAKRMRWLAEETDSRSPHTLSALIFKTFINYLAHIEHHSSM